MIKILKRPFYKLISYILNSDYVREELWHASKDIFVRSTKDFKIKYYKNPYNTDDPLSSIRKNLRANIEVTQDSPIFITSRFRSGSTFLWLIFRQLNNITAYYEPLNENKWFLTQNNQVDPTHIGVNSYSDEYKGLDYLNEYFKTNWSYKNLYMTEKSYDYNLYLYIKELINNSIKLKSRPLLQFNRIDLRLKWIKAYFPDVILLHIYRNPREQWMSIQIDGGPVPLDYKIFRHYTGPFLFYTIIWAKDLRHVFEFLEPEGCHPYEIHYYLWRLSYIWARNYVHYSFPYEELVVNFKTIVRELFDFIRLPYNDQLLLSLEGLNKGKLTERWKNYAPDEWFKEIEDKCDLVLSKVFSN